MILIVILFLFISAHKLNVTANLKAVKVFVIGCLAIVLPVLLYLQELGLLKDFLYLSFIRAPKVSNMLSQGFNLGRFFPIKLSPTQALDYFAVFFYICYILIFVTSLRFMIKSWRNIKKIKKQNFQQKYKLLLILTLFVFGVLETPHVFSVIDLGHLVKGGFPFMILGVYFLEGIIVSSKSFVSRLFYFIPLILFITGNIVITFWWIRFNDKFIKLPYGSVFLNSKYVTGSTFASADTILRTVEFIKHNSNRGDYIFLVPYHALFYFLTDRKSPTRYENFARGIVIGYEEEEVIREIRGKDIKLIVYDPRNGPQKTRFPEYNPKIDNYIMTNFRIVDETKEGWLYMLRK